jgi:dienelactone hydrolase
MAMNKILCFLFLTSGQLTNIRHLALNSKELLHLDMGKKIIRVFKAYVAAAMLIYIAFASYFYLRQSHYIYFPTHNLPAPEVVGLADMSLIDISTNDGLRLSGWYKPPVTSEKPVIIMFHGQGNTIADLHHFARECLDEGYGVLLAEYRGYGGNPGYPTEQRLYLDARAQLAWLSVRGFSPSHIVLFGQSFGATIAIQMATENSGYHALILDSPFASFVELAQVRYPYIPVSLLLKDRFDNITKIRKVKIPLFEFYGDKDTMVPNEQERRVFDTANKPKQLEIISGANHLDLYAHGAGAKVIYYLDHLAQ